MLFNVRTKNKPPKGRLERRRDSFIIVFIMCLLIARQAGLLLWVLQVYYCTKRAVVNASYR